MNRPDDTKSDPHGVRETLGPDDGEADPRVFAAMQEYMAAIDAGRHPNRKEFLARHADVADELSACIHGLAFVRSAAVGITAAVGAPVGSRAGGEQRPLDAEVAAAVAQPLGDFRLVREIGRGGMGVVYEAVQLSLGRRVAVKVLPLAGALDPRQLQRFRNEAQAAAQLHHSNIVPVYAVGYERSVHFYAMQYIEGQSLSEVIRELRRAAGRVPADPARHRREALGASGATAMERDRTVTGAASVSVNGVTENIADRDGRWRAVIDGAGPRPTDGLTALREGKRASFFESAARLGLQAAEALDYAHQVGVVHRDIKPANLLLDVQGTLWITDFGLAQLQTDSGLTQPGDMLGTFRYMSPEQASGKAVVLDQRTDIYSLGLTLYELLTLENALLGETREQLLYQIGYVDPRPPRSIDRTIPPELETILAKAAAKEPADRYASAKAMADDLRRYLQNEPIRARPPSIRDRAIKWMRRHKPLVASALVMLLLAAVGFLTSTILIAREQTKTKNAFVSERQQRARAEQGFQQAREAVATFAGIAADEMSDPGRFFEARKQLLEAALGYYQGFLREGQDDPAIGAELEAARTRFAAIVAELAAYQEFGRLLERRRLLGDLSVREALGMSPTQADHVTNLAFPWNPRLGATPDSRQLSPEEQAREFRELSPEEKGRRFAGMALAGETALAEILTPDQSTRLRQIALQVKGLSAFTDSIVAEALDLTPDQRGMVREAQDRHRDAWVAMVQTRTSEDVRWRELAARERAALANILENFEPEQTRKWAEMTGLPFKGTVQLLRPGGPPPARRRDERTARDEPRSNRDASGSDASTSAPTPPAGAPPATAPARAEGDGARSFDGRR